LDRLGLLSRDPRFLRVKRGGEQGDFRRFIQQGFDFGNAAGINFTGNYDLQVADIRW
jgi:hypothetical protein